MENELKRQLEGIIHRGKELFGLPSVSVALSKEKDTFYYTEGMADVEKKREADTDTVYSVGSSTKAFIATAVCILAEKGKLSLDMPVKTCLQEFRMQDEYSTEHLTVRDALCHRSGLPRHDASWLNTPHRTLEEQIAALAYMPSAWPIRYRFHYQNHMFMTITKVVEETAGEDWGSFVTKQILEPLGMDETYIYGDMLKDGDRRKAAPYMESGRGFIRMPFNYMKSAGGAGTMFSTTRDMLKWLEFRIYGNEKILGRKWLDEMHTPQMVIRPGEAFPEAFEEMEFASYGLAWFMESYRGYKTVHHGGTTEGFKSEQIFVPGKKIAVSILCNLNQTKAVTALGYELVDALLGLEKIDWCARYRTAEKAAVKKAQQETKEAIQAAQAMRKECGDVSEYAGLYEEQAYGTAEVLVRDGQVLLGMIGLTAPLIPTGKDRFHLVVESYGLCYPIIFERDGGGRIQTLAIPLEMEMPGRPVRFSRK